MIFASLQVLAGHALGECIIDDGLHGSVTGVFCILSANLLFRLVTPFGHGKFSVYFQSVGNDLGNLHGEFNTIVFL